MNTVCQLQLPDCQGHETIHGPAIGTATVIGFRSYLVCKNCLSIIVSGKIHRHDHCHHRSEYPEAWSFELLPGV